MNDVFEAISQKAYLPAAPQPQPKQEAHVPSVDPYALSYDDLPIPQGPQAPPTINGQRKRTYNDRGEPGAQNGRDQQFDGRSYKQLRRGGSGFGGRGGRSEDANSFNGGLPTPFGPLPMQFPPAANGGPMFDADAFKAFYKAASTPPGYCQTVKRTPGPGLQ